MKKLKELLAASKRILLWETCRDDVREYGILPAAILWFIALVGWLAVIPLCIIVAGAVDFADAAKTLRHNEREAEIETTNDPA